MKYMELDIDSLIEDIESCKSKVQLKLLKEKVSAMKSGGVGGCWGCEAG